MAWTVPTAIFFGTIALMLMGMTVWQVLSPSVARRGVLPLATTRGDRLFIGLLGSAFIHLGWLAVTDQPLWWASGIAVVFLLATMRWG
jgi:predicted small integral membrane protein